MLVLKIFAMVFASSSILRGEAQSALPLNIKGLEERTRNTFSPEQTASKFARSEKSFPLTYFASNLTGCSTGKCFNITNEIVNKMDTEIDVCENPYLYACGKWHSWYELPADRSYFTASLGGQAAEIEPQLRQLLDNSRCPKQSEIGTVMLHSRESQLWDAWLSCYYEACMSTSETHNHHRSIYALDALPLLHFLHERKIDWLLDTIRNYNAVRQFGKSLDPKQRTLQLTHQLGDLMHKLTVSPFFDIDVAPDVTQPMKNLTIHLSENGLNLDYEQYNRSDILEAYQTYLTSIFELTSKDLIGIIPENAAQRAANVIAMEKDMRDVTLSPREARNVTLTYNPMTWDDVQDELFAPYLDVARIVAKLASLGGHRLTERMTGRDTVIVDHPQFYKQTARMFVEKWPWETIQDYFFVQAYHNYAPVLTGSPLQANQAFRTAVSGAQPRPRWKECQLRTAARLGWILSRRYVVASENFNEKKRLVNSMVNSIKKAMGRRIKASSWMDDETKRHALLKLRSLVGKFAFPDWLAEENPSPHFTKHYGHMGADLFEALQNPVKTEHLIQTRAFLNDLKDLGKPRDRSKWTLFPYTVNAYNRLSSNEIFLPLSILRAPLFYPWKTNCRDTQCRREQDLYQVLSFGGLGSIIGHEIMHAFDDNGSEFDWAGNLKNWWSVESRRKFENETQCIREHYKGYAVYLPSQEPIPEYDPEPIFYMSGDLTVGENIADLGGFESAFDALKKRLPHLFESPEPTPPGSAPSFSSCQVQGGRVLRPFETLTPAQLFVLAFGQVWCAEYREKTLLRHIESSYHSPGFFRALGTLSNSEAAAQAFGCRPGSLLVPKRRQEFDNNVSPCTEDDCPLNYSPEKQRRKAESSFPPLPQTQRFERQLAPKPTETAAGTTDEDKGHSGDEDDGNGYKRNNSTDVKNENEEEDSGKNGDALSGSDVFQIYKNMRLPHREMRCGVF